MRKNAQVSWDDLLYVLAVAEHGSVSAAARALSVNHATVLRRIAAFESRQGFRIFDKTPRGYQVSADRRALIEAMQTAGEALADVDRMIDNERPRLSGGLRITTTDTLAQFVLPHVVPGLSEEIGSHIEVQATNTHLDFSRMEAHIAVRPTLRLPEDMSGEKAANIWFGVYAASRKTDEWLGHSGPLARSSAGAWVRRQAGQTRLVADSFLTLAALSAEGQGKAVLPLYVGDNWPGLKRLDVPKDLSPVPVWVASHVDFARSGRLLRARRYIVNVLSDAAILSEP